MWNFIYSHNNTIKGDCILRMDFSYFLSVYCLCVFFVLIKACAGIINVVLILHLPLQLPDFLFLEFLWICICTSFNFHGFRPAHRKRCIWPVVSFFSGVRSIIIQIYTGVMKRLMRDDIFLFGQLIVRCVIEFDCRGWEEKGGSWITFGKNVWNLKWVLTPGLSKKGNFGSFRLKTGWIDKVKKVLLLD